ncbi:MAG: sulfurtransferase [Beggiatoa sp. IS2]|nr:MAG: sulfurtransferase [Beggiatoa sp. IS2]
MRHFTPTKLNAYLQNNLHPPLLLDVREPWEFQICRIEGSQLLPMRQIPLSLSTLDSEQEIVLICHHGIRSRQVGLFLEGMGFTDVINLSGGVAAWSQEVDKTMPTY